MGTVLLLFIDVETCLWRANDTSGITQSPFSMSFIVDYAKDWALDKASGYLKTGIQAGGTLAGNAVGGVGSTIENGGRSFGEGTVTNGIAGVGNWVNGYGDNVKNAFAADGPASNTQKKSPTNTTNA